ncbi:MAG: hypothetical protein DRQ64_09990, partial [Gammaproteobacteria bacterium]
GDMLIVFAADGPTTDLVELNGNNATPITNATPFVQVNAGVTAEIKLREGWWMKPQEAGTYEVLNVGTGASLSIDSVANFYGNRNGGSEIATATIAGDVSVDNYMQLGNNFFMTMEGTGSFTTDGIKVDTWNSVISMKDGAAITFGTADGDLTTVALAEAAISGGTFVGLDGATLTATDNGNGTITIAAIPEPATMGLVAAAAAGILFIRRRFMI